MSNQTCKIDHDIGLIRQKASDSDARINAVDERLSRLESYHSDLLDKIKDLAYDCYISIGEASDKAQKAAVAGNPQRESMMTGRVYSLSRVLSRLEKILLENNSPSGNPGLNGEQKTSGNGEEK